MHRPQTETNKKTKGDQILAAVLKSLKSFLDTDQDYELMSASWTSMMESIIDHSYYSPPLEWLGLLKPTTARAPGMVASTASERDTERITRENVPQIVHADWSKKDRDRANEVS